MAKTVAPPMTKAEAPSVVPDGGWGWMVVLGSFILHILLGGLSRSYGLIYLQLREKFNSTAAITAWVGGMFVAFRMGGSKLLKDGFHILNGHFNE